MAAQLAATTVAVAAAIFIPPPFGSIVSAAITLITNSSIQAINGKFDIVSTLMTIASAAAGAVPFGSLANKILERTPDLASGVQKIAMNLEKITKKINSTIKEFTPDALLDRALKKWTGEQETSFVDDIKLIFQKDNELKTFGEIRTQNKISSVKINPDTTSWIQAAHFNETRFINKNNIIGDLTIFYYKNNGSRLNQRKNPMLNGNNNLVAITINGARYKNEYVSGICRAKSWGAYYMRTWMIGKPGSSDKGINTAIFFGSEWRVDLKLKSLIKQYATLDQQVLNFSEKVATQFLKKSKIGSKLLSFGDVYKKTTATINQVKGGNASNLVKPLFKKMKKK